MLKKYILESTFFIIKLYWWSRLNLWGLVWKHISYHVPTLWFFLFNSYN